MSKSSVHVELAVDPFFQENACVVFEQEGGRCWIVDPSFDPQTQQIANIVSEHSLTPAAILVTHCHGDHIAGIDAVKQRWPQVDLYVPAAEVDWLSDPVKNLSAGFGMNLRVATPVSQAVKPGDALDLDGLGWQALDVSGHSPGGTAYYCAAAGVLITGDAVFAGSIGRTDFPGSNTEQLLRNLRRNVLSLPDDVVIYPGHGPSTSVGQERMGNPYLR
jgi:glyoxylase-like metal-dependent hydrolase (beta-lactamase superfamily II)